MKTRSWFAFAMVALLLAGGCGGGSNGGGGGPEDPAEPAFDASKTTPRVDNPYLPLLPGTRFVFEGDTEEGRERIEVAVSHVRRTVMGVECTVVVDRAWLDGDLIEETFDWFCQDLAGNVWYMGEDSREIEDGEVVSTEGSWEAGVDGAQPGILIKAAPVVGDSWRQEYAAGVAEDMAEVVAVGVPVTLEDGSEHVAVKIREWNPLEADSVEFKYFASGTGLVREEDADGEEGIELVEVHLDTAPEIDPADFVPLVDNPWFPLLPGTTHVFEGETEDGDVRIEEMVATGTKTILGVVCTVVEVREYEDGELVEETSDWYAQDRDGNVWYFGEDSREIEDGEVVSTDGSWEAGVDGAAPGIVMRGSPRIGDSYRQEYADGEAEDMAEVVARDVPVTLADGTVHVTLVTREWTPLEPGQEELKYYAEGVGLVREAGLDGSDPIDRTE